MSVGCEITDDSRPHTPQHGHQCTGYALTRLVCQADTGLHGGLSVVGHLRPSCRWNLQLCWTLWHQQYKVPQYMLQNATCLPVWKSSTSPIQQTINSTHGDLAHWAVPCSWSSVLTVCYYSSLCTMVTAKRKKKRKTSAWLSERQIE